MTRKNALRRAIEILSINNENNEVVQKLQELLEEMPLVHWSDSSVRDAVEQFISDNGRVPTATDFKKRGLPAHPVIKQIYKVTLGEWLRHNYPPTNPPNLPLTEKHIQDFIDDYKAFLPKTQGEFNQKKRKETVRWQVVARHLNVTTWRACLSKLGLNTANKKTLERPSFKVNIHLDSDNNFFFVENTKEKT